MKLRNIFLIISALLVILMCKSTQKQTDEEKIDKSRIPGIATMERHGRKLGPDEILDKIGESMRGVPGGSIAESAFHNSLRMPNTNPVYVIESIEYNSEGLAINIKGHIEVPSSFREYVAKGGLGVPVYEAVGTNEFGVIFGRPGNIAVREGVVVKLNPLKDADIYDLKIGSETYDKINSASVLYQAYEEVRGPFLRNKIIEFQGILLNSSSKQAILEGIKKFKEENKKMNETELMLNFLAANKSYLKEIEQSTKEAKQRIKNGRELLDAISSASSMQTTGIVLLYAEMAKDIIDIVMDFRNMPSKILEYTHRNIPKNSSLTYDDLGEIRKYGNYQLKRYQNNLEKNQELWKKYIEITKNL
jgi:hypothetical protein